MGREHFQQVNHRGARLVVEIIELRDIGPGREKWIAAAREKPHFPRRSLDGAKRRRMAAERRIVALHVAIGKLVDPRMIESGVVWNEIDDEPHAPGAQLLANRGEIVPRSDSGIGFVAADAVGRADDIAGAPAGQRLIVRIEQLRFGPRDLPSERAPPPQPHEIHQVDAPFGEAVPLAFRYRPERQRSTFAARERVQPRPRVDLVQLRMSPHVVCHSRKRLYRISYTE